MIFLYLPVDKAITIEKQIRQDASATAITTMRFRRFSLFQTFSCQFPDNISCIILKWYCHFDHLL